MMFLSIPNQAGTSIDILPDIPYSKNWTSVYLYSGKYWRNVTLNGYSKGNNTYGVLVAECAGDIVTYKGAGTDNDGDFTIGLSTRLRKNDFESGRNIIRYIDAIKISLQYTDDDVTKFLPFPVGTYIRIIGTQSLKNN